MALAKAGGGRDQRHAWRLIEPLAQASTDHRMSRRWGDMDGPACPRGENWCGRGNTSITKNASRDSKRNDFFAQQHLAVSPSKKDPGRDYASRHTLR
jgi:hypothetical protein